MKKLIIIALLVMAVIMAGCSSGSSSDSDSDGDGATTSWVLQADGSWKSSDSTKTLSGTTGAYMSEIKGGQPVKVNSINSSNYTYENTSGTAKTVIIKTAGGNLTINAPLDTVWHYGTAGTVTVTAVASMSYDGHAEITTSLIAKSGHIKLFDSIAVAIPLISVPADATGAVDIEIPAGVVVADVTVASGVATSLDVAGSVATITAPVTTSIDVSGDVETVSGGAIATVSGDGYVEDRGDGNSEGTPYVLDGNTYQIKLAAGLKAIADLVNDGNDLSGKTVQLLDNLNLAKYGNWTPIGKKGGNFFAGTFDGNGKEIYGLNVNDVAGFADYMGLFGRIQNATIKSLTVSGAVTSTVDAAGGIVARMDGGTVQDCVSNVTVNGVNKAGGVVCLTNGPSLISGCINNGTVNATKNAGGILGLANPGTQVRDCINTADVTITTNTNVGGILGDAQANGTTLEGDGIFNCANSGAITGKTNGDGTDRVGGIAGILELAAGEYTYVVSGCINSGSVDGFKYSGGIVGIVSTKAAITGCSNSGTITAHALQGSGHVSYPAGIVACISSSSTVEGCTNSGTIVSVQNGSTYEIIGDDAR